MRLPKPPKSADGHNLTFLLAAPLPPLHPRCVDQDMEHALTIASTPGAGTELGDEPFLVMADINVGAFEDAGFPEFVAGKLLDVPDRLVENVRGRGVVRVELGGRIYRFTGLNPDGTFQLRKYDRAQVLPAQI